MPSEATAEKEPHHQVTLIKPLFLLYTINTCLSVSFILSFATSVSSTPKCCYLLLAALCFWNLPTLTRDQEAFLFDPSFQTSGKRVNHDSPASGRKKKDFVFFSLFSKFLEKQRRVTWLMVFIHWSTECALKGNLEAVGVPTSVPVRVAHELLLAGHKYLDVR